MSRKIILAVAAVAALGMSSLVATDAFARGGGGGGGHGGGGHFGGGGSFSRASFHTGRVSTGRINTGRNFGRTFHPNRFVNSGRFNHRFVHYNRFHHNHWWAWCRFHHHYRCGGYGIGVYAGVAPTVVADAPQAVAATPAAAVCNNDCDYFLNNEPGCYMAKRKFSTPQGDELRCVKICDEPGSDQAPK
jgi:hypothetical protein